MLWLQMLESFGMRLSKENFARLVGSVTFPEGGMAYVDFLFAFQACAVCCSLFIAHCSQTIGDPQCKCICTLHNRTFN